MISTLKKLIPNNFKPALRKWLIGHDIGTYYFSQVGEDIILHAIFDEIFGDVKTVKGKYIDVGAYDPVKFSNTYFFYKCGWRGINIDPRPGCMESFKKIRPEDVNLEIGISGKEEILTYYDLGANSSMNSFSKENLKMFGIAEFAKEIPIHTYPLSTVLDKYLNGNRIDFLNIDAEGFDFEILQSNNWEKYRPKIICAELCPIKTINDILETETYKFLKEKRYSPYAKNYITNKVSSVIFVDDELNVKR